MGLKKTLQIRIVGGSLFWGINRTCFLWFWALHGILLMCVPVHAMSDPALVLVSDTAQPGYFPLVSGDQLAPLWYDADDDRGVIRAINDLQKDIERVTDRKPELTTDRPAAGVAVIIGTLGKGKLIDTLVTDGRLDISPIKGKWEAHLIAAVDNPFPGISKGLVIVGNDKRGTIYGVYTLSEQIGVSPWYWWADVPVKKRDALYIQSGLSVYGPPAVRFRGIFLNDEAPALSNWVHEKFGGFNHEFYTKVFELLLRLKANYLWPAMWNNSFNSDDPLNPQLADEYGIVMGTSHHEPMMRAWKEWGRLHPGMAWDYSKNPEVLREFWREGLQRTREYEKVITLAMRGDGDEPMSEKDNVALLEKIVTDQRQMIEEVINNEVTKVPQVWALYKEVQGYYERGMRVPDDVILLWCDDNWGNLRRLPTETERLRPGGAGIYYHFDYVGGPRSYRWINTNPIPKIWEQMNLACHYGADQIWIVNVGDLKPMEFPTEFFLTMAWDPNRWPRESLKDYSRHWTAREFGAEYSDDIADIIAKYTKYNGRCKPELLAPDTFSLTNYREAETVLDDYKAIVDKAERIYDALSTEARDAFFQLVLHPAQASRIMTELNITVGKNRLYASQGRSEANLMANKVRELFEADAKLTERYHSMANGKWNHMMDQTHIGYTNWNNPPRNIMPKVTEITLPQQAGLGVAIEGATQSWPASSDNAELPQFNRLARKKYYIEVFNKGSDAFEFTADADKSWITLSRTEARVSNTSVRLWVDIDWSQTPSGRSEGVVTITGVGEKVSVHIHAFNPDQSELPQKSFVETDGYVSIEPEHYSARIDTTDCHWEKIDDYGLYRSAMSLFPVTVRSVIPGPGSPCLEYNTYLFTSGKIELLVYVSPTLNFIPGRGLQMAVSFDAQSPQVINVVPANYTAGDGNRDWEQTVIHNARIVKSTHNLSEPGSHILKIWMVDPGIVVQKLVINTGGLRPSRLGPPESPFLTFE